jgi:hypothetical protein
MLAVVIILAVLFWTTSNEPLKEVKTPYSIPKVENLARVELTKPGDGGLVVLQKGGDGWKLTKPVEAPVAERVGTKLDEELAGAINTDDIKLSKDKAAEYELDDAHATKVALYSKGADSPAAEFDLGKTISVPGTRAKRTYIRGSDGKIYRAHTSLGQTLGGDTSKLRSKKIQEMDRNEISDIKVSYHDGQTVHLVRDGKEWKLKEPAVDYELEKGQVSALVRNLSHLMAKDFVDDKKPADVGLQPAHTTIVAKAGDETKILKLSGLDEEAAHNEEEETYYVKPDKSPHIYAIAETTGNALSPTALSLRKRLVHEIDKESVVRIDFGGKDRIVVQKKGDEWSFVRGAKGTVKQSAIQSRLNSLARLRALRFDDVSLADAGLDQPSDKVTFETEDGNYTLLFGKRAPGGEDDRGNLYAKWADTDLVMVIAEWVKDRSTPSASDLLADES